MISSSFADNPEGAMAALDAFKKSKKCVVCEQNTGGVFNVAKGESD